MRFKLTIIAALLCSSLLALTPPTVYVANFTDDTVSAIDTTSNTVVSTLAVGSGPQFMAITPDNQTLVVLNSSGNTASIIDTASNAVLATIVLGAGGALNNIVISSDGVFAYIAGASSINVVNISTLSLTSTIAFPAALKDALALSPDGNHLYAFGVNICYVVETAGNTIETTIDLTTNDRPFSAVFKPDGSYIYVSTESNSVQVINASNNTLSSTISIIGTSAGLAITPDGSTLYTLNTSGNDTNISVINTASQTVTETIALSDGSSPQFITITPDGAFAYLSLFSTDSVSVINTSTNTIVDSISVGSGPVGIVSTYLYPPQNVTGVQKTNNFGIASENFNRLTWTPSRSTITGYRVKRGNTLIATLSPDTLSFSDHNRPKGSTAYTVSAYNAAGNESFSVPLSVQ